MEGTIRPANESVLRIKTPAGLRLLENIAIPAAPDRRDRGGVLCVSDLHLGLWGDRNDRYSILDKAGALESMVDTALSAGARTLLLNGDVLDDRAGKAETKRDATLAKVAILRFADSGGRVALVRGNHDRHIKRRQFQKLLGMQIEVIRGHLFADASGVVGTHGHILETKRSKLLIEALEGPEASAEAHSDARRAVDQDEAMEAELDAMDALNAAIAGLESYRTLRHTFEMAECRMRLLRSRVSEWVRRLSKAQAKHLHQWADGLDLRSIHRAGRLAAAMGGWCSVFGHDHTPGVYRRDVKRRSGAVDQILIGNSGSFIQHRQPITCLLARHPTLRLMRYDRKAASMREWYGESLAMAGQGSLTGAIPTASHPHS